MRGLSGSILLLLLASSRSSPRRYIKRDNFSAKYNPILNRSELHNNTSLLNGQLNVPIIRIQTATPVIKNNSKSFPTVHRKGLLSPYSYAGLSEQYLSLMTNVTIRQMKSRKQQKLWDALLAAFLLGILLLLVFICVIIVTYPTY